MNKGVVSGGKVMFNKISSFFYSKKYHFGPNIRRSKHSKHILYSTSASLALDLDGDKSFLFGFESTILYLILSLFLNNLDYHDCQLTLILTFTPLILNM